MAASDSARGSRCVQQVVKPYPTHHGSFRHFKTRGQLRLEADDYLRLLDFDVLHIVWNYFTTLKFLYKSLNSSPAVHPHAQISTPPDSTAARERLQILATLSAREAIKPAWYFLERVRLFGPPSGPWASEGVFRQSSTPTMAGPLVSYATVENAARAAALAQSQQAILQRLSALEERASLSGTPLQAQLPQKHMLPPPEVRAQVIVPLPAPAEPRQSLHST